MNFKFKNKFLFISLLNFLSIFYLIAVENSKEYENFRSIFFCEYFDGPKEDILDCFNAYKEIEKILSNKKINDLSGKNKKKIQDNLKKIFKESVISEQEKLIKQNSFGIYSNFKIGEETLNEFKNILESKEKEKIMDFILDLKKDYFSDEIRKTRVDIFKKTPNNVLSELSGIEDQKRLQRALDFYEEDNNNSWELSKEGYKDLLLILRQELEVKLDYISGDILSREEKEYIKIEYEKNFISQITLNSSKVQIEKIIDNNSCFIDEIISERIFEKKKKEKENQKLEKKKQILDSINYEAEKEKLKKFPLMEKFQSISDIYNSISKNKNFDKKKFVDIKPLIDKLKNNEKDIDKENIELLEKKIMALMQSIYDKENSNKGNKNNCTLLKDLEEMKNNFIVFKFLEKLKNYEDKNKNKKEMKLLEEEKKRKEYLNAIEEYIKEQKEAGKNFNKEELESESESGNTRVNEDNKGNAIQEYIKEKKNEGNEDNEGDEGDEGEKIYNPFHIKENRLKLLELF